MTSHRTDDANDANSDLSSALRSLGDSMNGLSEEMTGLHEAVVTLQASTDDLRDRQRAVSEEMATTAEGLDGSSRHRPTEATFDRALADD